MAVADPDCIHSALVKANLVLLRPQGVLRVGGGLAYHDENADATMQNMTDGIEPLET